MPTSTAIQPQIGEAADEIVSVPRQELPIADGGRAHDQAERPEEEQQQPRKINPTKSRLARIRSRDVAGVHRGRWARTVGRLGSHRKNTMRRRAATLSSLAARAVRRVSGP